MSQMMINVSCQSLHIIQHPCLQVSITKHKGSPSPRKQSPPTPASSHGHGGGHGGSRGGGHKSGVNIMADLAVQTNKRNLLVGGGGGGNGGSKQANNYHNESLSATPCNSLETVHATAEVLHM